MSDRLAGDVLTDWMRVSRTFGVVLARNLLPARWAITVDAGRGAAFHYVPRGHASLRVGTTKVELGEGDLVIVSRGTAHFIGDSHRTRPRSLASVSPATPFPGPICTTLICGEYRSDRPHPATIAESLPEIVHLRASEIATNPSLLAVLHLIDRELAAEHPGTESLIRNLLDALFVYVLRAHAATAHCTGGWLAALRDPALARALAAIHGRPAHGWTVASLGEVARLSRAAFARRFTSTLAESPLAYVTRLRMVQAVRLLEDRNLSVGEIARHVGYTSEFAFSRAFKRLHGKPPTAMRAPR